MIDELDEPRVAAEVAIKAERRTAFPWCVRRAASGGRGRR
jgi:hypothetical protein